MKAVVRSLKILSLERKYSPTSSRDFILILVIFSVGICRIDLKTKITSNKFLIILK